ncbi:MAG: cell division protein FtsQ/DivIB [Pseudomonadota bacterium]
MVSYPQAWWIRCGAASAIVLLLCYVVWPYLNVHDIRVRGVFQESLHNDIEALIAPQRHKKFWRIPLGTLERQIAAMPWVENLTVRRMGLSSIEIRVLEQQPIARWHLGGTFMVHGAWLPIAPSNASDLPLLTGPEVYRDLVFNHFLSFKTQLDSLGISLVAVELAPRGAWELHTQQGFRLILGREEMMKRLQRFVWSYDKVLREQASEIAYVDLRYTSGIAIGWRSGRPSRLT